MHFDDCRKFHLILDGKPGRSGGVPYVNALLPYSTVADVLAAQRSKKFILGFRIHSRRVPSTGPLTLKIIGWSEIMIASDTIRLVEEIQQVVFVPAQDARDVARVQERIYFARMRPGIRDATQYLRLQFGSIEDVERASHDNLLMAGQRLIVVRTERASNTPHYKITHQYDTSFSLDDVAQLEHALGDFYREPDQRAKYLNNRPSRLDAK